MGRSYNHWSEAEVAALKEGVRRFGVGNWQKIVNDYPVLRHRTGVQLKDKYRNMIKFRHLAINEMGASPPQQRRSSSSRAAAQRSPAPAAAEAAATADSQPQAASLPTQQQAAGVARSAGASSAQRAKEQQQPAAPPLTAQQQQDQLAAEQAATQQRLQQAQAAIKPVQHAYVQQLAAAAIRRAAAAAAMDEAAAVAAPGAQADALQQVAQWQQQQAELAQQMLLAARQVYLQVAEEVQQAQAAANAAVSAVLQAAETAADSAPLSGMLPGTDAHVAATVVRHSNRRKAALNRKRFLDEEGGVEEPHSRPVSSQGGTTAAASGVAQMDVEEMDGSRPPSAAGGKRRRVGAQKRLHEDTRFGIYDDRRYRAGPAGSGSEAPLAHRRRTSSGGGSAPAHSDGGVRGRGGAARGGAALQRRRRRRRQPHHLASEFGISDDDEDEDFELDAELADAELAEADEAEEEWQRQIKQEQHDVDCLCGVSYDDGEEMIECEGCGVWAHIACLARYGRLRHSADRYICSRCQGGFGSPMAAGTPTAAGALSPRGVAVALGARRQAFRNDSFNNDELYDIAAFLDNMGPHHRLKLQRSGSLGPGSARARSASAQQLAALGSMEAALGCSSPRAALPLGLPVPQWGGSRPRRPRNRRSGSDLGQHPWPSADVMVPAPHTKRHRLPPPHPGTAAGAGLAGPLSGWHQMPSAVAAGLAAAHLSGLHQQSHMQPPPHLPPFMPFGGPPPTLGAATRLSEQGLSPAAVAAAAAAAAAAAGMTLGRSWGQQPDTSSVAEPAAHAQQENQKAAAVAELMQIMQGAGSGLGLPPPPRPSLPAATASALLSSRQPTPSPPIDLMHRDLHDVDLQDDLHAQDWLAAAASLARADSQPTYPAFPVGPLDGASGSHHLPSLGGSPARPPSLSNAGVLPLPPPLAPMLGLQEQHQHWMAVMSSLQQQQQQQRVGAGRGEPAAAAAGAAAPHLRPSLALGLPPEPPFAAVHRRLHQLAAGAGAAAANATAAAAAGGAAGGSGSGSRRQSGGLDAAQQQDGFGRYRQGSLHSLQQLAPDLQVEGLHGLTPSASARADSLMSDDDADLEGPHLIIPGGQQHEQPDPKQQPQQQPPPDHKGDNQE